MFSPDLLKGRHILITGGGSGLGLLMAKAFAMHGANISICGRNEEKLEKARKEIAEIAHVNVLAYSADVKYSDQVASMFQYFEKEGGTLNGLVNNAAGNFLSASEDLSPNAFKAVVDTVLNGSFYTSLLFGKSLISQGTSGTIVNIVTTYTQTGCAFVLPSACAKAGVEAMTKSLAYEWASYGIRVNAIAPGPFPTEGAWTRLVPDQKLEKAFLAKNPSKRYGRPEEIQNAALYLMSDASSYVNGTVLTIDGGERLSGGQFNFIDQLYPRDVLKNFFQTLKPKK